VQLHLYQTGTNSSERYTARKGLIIWLS